MSASQAPVIPQNTTAEELRLAGKYLKVKRKRDAENVRHV